MYKHTKMVYKQVLFPDKENHSIEMPEQFFGRKVEVVVVEIANSAVEETPLPPVGKKVGVNELLEDFGNAPDFPTIEEIRNQTWPSKW